MNPEDIKKIITDRFPDKLKDARIAGFEPSFIVEKDILLEFCRYLRDSEELCFDLLSCMSGADYPDRFEMIYIFFSFTHRHKTSFKIHLSKESPEIDSLTPLFPGANWYERETTELFGIRFKNHPDPRPLLLPEGWDEGYPLRKDWSGKDFIKMPDLK